MGEKIGVPFGTMGRAHRARKNLNSIMGLSQWEREGEKEMAVTIIAGNLGIGPGSVQATPREEEKEKPRFPKDLERAKVKVGQGQTNVVKVRGKDLGEKVREKVGGTKVDVSTVVKLDIKQRNA